MKYKPPITEEKFNSLPELEQWKWILEHRSEIIICLDNDSTDITFKEEDKTKDGTMLFLKAYIGNSEGAECILEALGIEYQNA